MVARRRKKPCRKQQGLNVDAIISRTNAVESECAVFFKEPDPEAAHLLSQNIDREGRTRTVNRRRFVGLVLRVIAAGDCGSGFITTLTLLISAPLRNGKT
jgi:hypothetical protein